MTSATPLGALDVALGATDRETPRAKRRLPVLPVAQMLEAQRTMTAVERFAHVHETGDVGAATLYRDLVPLTRPRAGEQYAFEVDLDACTGCKACVSACHTLNGLDESELWRTVGLLHGGTASAPAVQTVTTSCHHCVEPACLLGCPTLAYEKDPVTGIVKHLDDQCFGCEYCTLMCPYDAPKYNPARGIVRKCDMCSDRLAHGEAPACVQACPNGAIAIRVVAYATAIEAANAQSFLPGVATPEHTIPTTVYKSAKALPANLLPADFYRTRAEHGHPPLVVMLVLTQLSIGAFLVEALVGRFAGPAENALLQATFAAALALVALASSVFHLGRPALAWRVVLGWRTSWLSREAIALGTYAGLVLAYGAVMATGAWPEAAPALENAASLAGLLGVFGSVMVYVATRREQWSSVVTGLKFFGTTILLGAASVFVLHACADRPAIARRIAPALGWVVCGVTVAKLALEAAVLRRRSDSRHSVAKRMAVVMLGDLWTVTRLRFACAVAGGLVAPLVLSLEDPAGRAGAIAAAIMLVLLVAGELAERYLFFRAAPASRMPGGIR
jgi:Fe-S-cluster-containing dehydrogenase component/DMSO reductase anchor subunit